MVIYYFITIYIYIIHSASITYDQLFPSLCTSSTFTLRKLNYNLLHVSNRCKDVRFSINKPNSVVLDINSDVLTKNPNNPLILSITDTTYYVIFSNKRYTKRLI